jgi:hypothetical protein
MVDGEHQHAARPQAPVQLSPIAELPESAWQRCSAVAGAHGLRPYDWARIELWPGSIPAGSAGCWPAAASPPVLGETADVAFYVCAES